VTSFSGKYYTILPPRRRLIGLLMAVSLFGGCQPGMKNGPPEPVAHADRIGLYVPDAAVVNWDGQPGFDGILAQVMLFRDEPGGKLKSILVTGEIDMILYEGSQPASLDLAGKPFRVWTFTRAELARMKIGQYGVLWGYSMRLAWGRRVPKPIPEVDPETEKETEKIWLRARYRSPMGKVIYSSPIERPMPLEEEEEEKNERPIPPVKGKDPILPAKDPLPIE